MDWDGRELLELMAFATGKKITANRGLFSMVPRVGLEPTHLAAGDFESPASTNFATWAVDLAY